MLTAHKKDHAQAALARQIKLAGVAAVGVIATAIGGPIAGVIVGAIAAPVGSILENLAANKLVDDGRLLSEFNEVTLWSLVVDTFTSLAGSGAGASIKKSIAAVGKPALDKISNTIIKKITDTAIDGGSDYIGGQLVDAYVPHVYAP